MLKEMKGNFVLGLESTAKRMSRLAKMEIYLERFIDIDEVIEQINSVKREAIHQLAGELLKENRFSPGALPLRTGWRI